MKTIPLTQGKVALVSDEDYERIAAHDWCAHRERGRWYALRRKPLHPSLHIRMHREILGAPDGVEVDHVDRDGLNNQRENIRLATTKQNGANKGKTTRSTTSRFIGVSATRITHRRPNLWWRAMARLSGKYTYLGSFKNEVDAARTYDRAILVERGEFAVTNFPREEYGFPAAMGAIGIAVEAREE